MILMDASSDTHHSLDTDVSDIDAEISPSELKLKFS